MMAGTTIAKITKIKAHRAKREGASPALEATLEIQAGIMPGGGPVDLVEISTFVSFSPQESYETVSNRIAEQAYKSLCEAASLSLGDIKQALADTLKYSSRFSD